MLEALKDQEGLPLMRLQLTACRYAWMSPDKHLPAPQSGSLMDPDPLVIRTSILTLKPMASTDSSL